MGSALPLRPGLWPSPLLLGVNGGSGASQLRGLHLGLLAQQLPREVHPAQWETVGRQTDLVSTAGFATECLAGLGQVT